MKKLFFLILFITITSNAYSSNVSYLDVQYIIDNSDIGSYTITHETNGICPDSVSIELNISTYADISFTLSEEFICDTVSSIELNASPTGGLFTGTGVQGAMFNPAIAGLGVHSLSYSYDNLGCISSVEQSITVENCSSVNDWRSMGFRLAVGKNNCYSKSDVLILPNQGK